MIHPLGSMTCACKFHDNLDSIVFKSCWKKTQMDNKFSSQLVTYWCFAMRPLGLIQTCKVSPLASPAEVLSLPWRTTGSLASVANALSLPYSISVQRTKSRSPHVLPWRNQLCVWLEMTSKKKWASGFWQPGYGSRANWPIAAILPPVCPQPNIL